MKDKSSIKKKTGKFAAACLALALSAGLFIPVSAEGDGQQYVPEWPGEQELKQKGSIIAEECKADASFDVYQVAEMTTSGFKETAALSAYQAVDVSDPGKNTGTLTETLKDIVVNAKVTPSVEGKVIHTTDKDAVIAEGLEPGLYLVKGKSLDEEKAEMTDFLVSVPNYNFDKDQWDFDVKVDVTKFTTIKPEQAHYKLRKLWNKQADTKLPSEIKVQIYEDGEPFEEVTLNDNNKWTFTWNTTDTKAVFTVSEENLGDDYTVSKQTAVEDGVTTILLTNTEKPKPTPTPTPTPKSPDTRDNNHTILYLGILLASGIVMIGAGLLKRKAER